MLIYNRISIVKIQERGQIIETFMWVGQLLLAIKIFLKIGQFSKEKNRVYCLLNL